jgi:hypothetical protein
MMFPPFSGYFPVYFMPQLAICQARQAKKRALCEKGAQYLQQYLLPTFHNFANAQISQMDNKANAGNTEHHHKRHNLIGQERKNGTLDEKPVVFPIVQGVANPSPYQYQQNACKLLPKFLQLQLHKAKSQIQNTPAEQNPVEHKGLKNQIAEWRLPAQGRTGIAHPHHRRSNSKRNHRGFKLSKALIKLNKWGQAAHKRADMEGKLMGGNAAVAVRQGHQEKIRHIKANG